LFSTATEVVTAGGGEPALIVTETATANVDMVHDGMYMLVFEVFMIALCFSLLCKMGPPFMAFGLVLV